MEHILDLTGLTYLWGKIKNLFATKAELAGHPTGRIYYGTCSTTANTYIKEATVETFPLDEDDKPLVGTVVAIKYSVSNTYKTEGQTYALNVNNTGAYPMYYNNAAVATSTSANTLVAGYKNRHVFYVFNGTQWVWLSASYDTNTTYSGMTQTEVDAGTGTTARLITPARLRDNFYTEGEVDTLLGSKANSNDLATVATSGSYNDLSNTPTIPTVPTNVSSFINDAGYLTSHQDISGKQDTIADSEDIVKVTGVNSDTLKLADKAYSSANFSGLGRKYLRKNIVDVSGTDKNVLTSAMVADANTIYNIQYDYDLNGQTITLPAGCVLEFDGGSLSNGTLVGNYTEIVSAPEKIFSGITFVDFNNVFEARWFVSKVNKTVLDSTLYDCCTELNYAFNSGIRKIHFSNDVYYVSDTISVNENISVSGEMLHTYTFSAWNDAQRQNVLNDNTFKGIFTNTGKTIIAYGESGSLVKSLDITGVNFITDYYSFDSTYDDTIPVVSIKGYAVWGFNFDGSITTMSNSQQTKGIGLLLSTYGSGYVTDINIRGGISGFDKCIQAAYSSGWINCINIDASLVGYQGFTGNANHIFARGVFQAYGNKSGNDDGFFQTDSNFVLCSIVFDVNSEGRVKYDIKRTREERYTNLITPYVNNSQNILRGIKKTYSYLDYVPNSVLRRCLEKATITSRLYNAYTNQDISYTLNNISEIGTLDTNVFASGTNIDMNGGVAFSSSDLDNIAFDLSITTNTNELMLNNYKTFFVYLYHSSRDNAQTFKYLDIQIATTGNYVMLEKNNVPLENDDGYIYDVIQYVIGYLASQKYVIKMTLHGLTKTTTSVYIGAIGLCNLQGNSPDLTSANIYKQIAVNKIVPLGTDNSVFYEPNMSKMTGTHNWKTLYVGTLKFTNTNVNDSCYLKGAFARGDILYSTEFIIFAYKNTSNTDAVFKLWSYLGSDANNNEVELHYEKTTSGTTQIYDLYLVLQGPNTRTFFNITELRQTGWGYCTFEKLYADDHAASGTTPLIGYLGTSGNNTKTNTLLSSTSYVASSMWYDKENKRTLFFAGDALGWIDVADGAKASVKRSGTFSQKPSSSDISVGFRYFCTDKQTTEGATAGIPIFHKGSDVWVDALGRTIT